MPILLKSEDATLALHKMQESHPYDAEDAREESVTDTRRRRLTLKDGVGFFSWQKKRRRGQVA
jgi:hypothetical protein